ncbi:MAG: MBL fold metallo-hydrolase [Lachnospiraceae bacterium]|nr:MBL fold metallo-hydrolase [Lachnospiraceae bacterium]
MELCSIASGSSGNCIFTGSGSTRLLIDTGLSKKRILEGLAGIDVGPGDLDGILITHEHADHVCGLGVMARALHIPIYATRGTIRGIKGMTSLGKIDEDLFQVISADVDFTVGDLTVHPFHISHDANDPVAYRITDGRRSVAVATDMGTYDAYTIRNLEGVNGLVLESNHDIRMLEVGPYPYPLKQRVAGEYGHLSNEWSGRLLSEILHDDISQVFLGHLSQQNNIPELAYETVKLEVTLGENPYRGEDLPIGVASRTEPTRCVTI